MEMVEVEEIDQLIEGLQILRRNYYSPVVEPKPGGLVIELPHCVCQEDEHRLSLLGWRQDDKSPQRWFWV